jgi:hypothetical protein
LDKSRLPEVQVERRLDRGFRFRVGELVAPGGNPCLGHERCYSLVVRMKLLRHLLATLVALAVIGAGSPRFASAEEPSGQNLVLSQPCTMAMMPAESLDHQPIPAKARGMATDCADHACCVVSAVVPGRLATERSIVHACSVAYWSAGLLLAGVAHRPEPLPPRAA